jgi:glutamyl-tRNA synthetase
MPIRTRFAPSPTGYLHVGGARTALFNWLFARHHGGEFVLRVEDTDAARNTDEALAAIFEGLQWLGLDWDGEVVFQGQRHAIYQRYLDQLKASGHVYEDDGAIRFRFPNEPVTLRDVICGEQTVNLAELGASGWDEEKQQHVDRNPDLVIRRPDGTFLFHFVNVVDDIEMGITHVIRGEDHLSNTPKHIALYRALGAPEPVFAHIPLILNNDGSKMSKRDTGAALGTYIEEGFLPAAVVNYLVLLGWSPKEEREIFSLSELVERFDLAQVNHSNARFDMEKCRWLNGQYIAAADEADYLSGAAAFAPEGTPAELLGLVRTKIRRYCEIPGHLRPVLDADFPLVPEFAAKVASKPESSAHLEALADRLAMCADWSDDGIKATVSETATALGVKMGALMFPLRVAIMGTGEGVDLVPALRLIGREDSVARIRARIPAIFQ